MKSKRRTRENIIRLMCFLLGILLTLSGVLIKERVIAPRLDERNEEITEDIVEEEDEEKEEIIAEEPTPVKNRFESSEELLENELTIGDSHVELAELEQYQEEAEVKLQELKEQPVLEPGDDVSYSATLICNLDGKPSKINWKPFYTAAAKTYTYSLAQKEQERSSYEETLAINAFDKMVIEDNTVNFNGVKITVMGDSLSAAANLNDEDAKQYNWPKILGEILGCDVSNQSVGGSSVSSCATTDPMVKRWGSIPDDSDIIIVFGGTNDCLFETRDQCGILEYDYRMHEDTICGDLDRLLSGMKWTYHEHTDDHYVRMIYVNPPSTILNDGVVAVDPNRYVPQSEFATAINEMAPNYGFDVIDLYNTNFLNSHDYMINSEFMLDGVHGNIAAYQILAEHIASEIIQMVQQE